MTYTPGYTGKTALELRREKGSLAKKIASELSNIETEFTSVQTELNASVKVSKGALAAGAADAFAFAWQNPESVKILVQKVMVDITTAGGTATAVLNVGTAANATTGSDNLIDGADLNATAVYDTIDDQGTNGNANGKLDENGGTTDYITGQIKVEAASSLAGKYYIFYVTV